MAFCSNCGTQLSNGVKFCPKCGTPTERTQGGSSSSSGSSNCSIVLVSAGAAKLEVAKALREILDIGLKEAKDIIDSVPCTIIEGLTLSDAKGNAQYLRECGAVTAIKQNGKTIQEDNLPKYNVSAQGNTIIESDNIEEGLSTWEKIALGVAGFIAFFGICGGFADGMWIAALVSLCALGAVCAVFMGAIEKKYAWATAIASLLIVLVTIGASAPDENEKTSSPAQTEQQQESQTEKKESNPFAKFAGKYVLYDDEGGIGQRFIVAPDGRFLQDHSFNESNFEVCGGIIPKNDKQFEVSLSERIFSIKEVWSYKNNHTYAKAWDISYNNTLLFDLNENRMYIDIKQYNNRDYTKPEYYKFRFTKQ